MYKMKIKKWVRHVNLWDGDVGQIIKFTEELNNTEKDMQFKKDIEKS